MPSLFAGIFDGSWVDIFTLVTAIGYSLLMHKRVGIPAGKSLVCRETGLSIAHGVALFPLFLLAVSSISSHALDALLHSHKIILSVAGGLALLAILEERPAT
jgi:hypothetical protein